MLLFVIDVYSAAFVVANVVVGAGAIVVGTVVVNYCCWCCWCCCCCCRCCFVVVVADVVVSVVDSAGAIVAAVSVVEAAGAIVAVANVTVLLLMVFLYKHIDV